MSTPLNERIRSRREELGLSQSEVAKMIGVGQSSVADIESGVTKNPRKPTLRALANALQSTFGLDWIKSELQLQGISLDTVFSRYIRGAIYDELNSGEFDELIRRIVREELAKSQVNPPTKKVNIDISKLESLEVESINPETEKDRQS